MADKIEIHKQLCEAMHSLYEKKNADYGDSFAQLRKRYPNFVCMRLFDKLNRLDTLIQPGYKAKVQDEKLEDTLMDIANYCIMELTEREAEAKVEMEINVVQRVPKRMSPEGIANSLIEKLQGYSPKVRELVYIKLQNIMEGKSW